MDGRGGSAGIPWEREARIRGLDPNTITSPGRSQQGTSSMGGPSGALDPLAQNRGRTPMRRDRMMDPREPIDQGRTPPGGGHQRDSSFSHLRRGRTDVPHMYEAPYSDPREPLAGRNTPIGGSPMGEFPGVNARRGQMSRGFGGGHTNPLIVEASPSEMTNRGDPRDPGGYPDPRRVRPAPYMGIDVRKTDRRG